MPSSVSEGSPRRPTVIDLLQLSAINDPAVRGLCPSRVAKRNLGWYQTVPMFTVCSLASPSQTGRSETIVRVPLHLPSHATFISHFGSSNSGVMSRREYPYRRPLAHRCHECRAITFSSDLCRCERMAGLAASAETMTLDHGPDLLGDEAMAGGGGGLGPSAPEASMDEQGSGAVVAVVGGGPPHHVPVASTDTSRAVPAVVGGPPRPVPAAWSKVLKGSRAVPVVVGGGIAGAVPASSTVLQYANAVTAVVGAGQSNSALAAWSNVMKGSRAVTAVVGGGLAGSEPASSTSLQGAHAVPAVVGGGPSGSAAASSTALRRSRVLTAVVGGCPADSRPEGSRVVLGRVVLPVGGPMAPDSARAWEVTSAARDALIAKSLAIEECLTETEIEDE